MSEPSWPPRIGDLNFPDDAIGWPRMADGRRRYPFDADVAPALSASGMMLGDRSERSLRLARCRR